MAAHDFLMTELKRLEEVKKEEKKLKEAENKLVSPLDSKAQETTPKNPKASKSQDEPLVKVDDEAVRTAIKASMVLPTMPLIRLMRSEAVEHLEAGRLERAALNLFQFQSISLRHQAIFQYNKRIKAALKEDINIKSKRDKKKGSSSPTVPLKRSPSDAESEGLEKDILDFRTCTDETESGRELLGRIQNDLSPEWRIVQLTVDPRSRSGAGESFLKQPHHQPVTDGNFGLMVVTAQCGNPSDGSSSNDLPLNVVPVPAIPSTDKMPTVMKEFHDIMSLHIRMYKSDQVANAIPPTKEQKKQRKLEYVRLKGEIDDRLSSLIDTMENAWLGWAKVLLLGKPVDRARLEGVQKVASTLQEEFLQSDKEFAPSGRKQALERIVDGASLLNEEQFGKGLTYVLEGTSENESVLPKFLARLKDLRNQEVDDSCDPFEAVRRHPVVFVLDSLIQQLPWESLKCFQGPTPQPLSRVPSVAFLCALAARHVKSKTSVASTGVREDKIFYVLNPDNNLANTQKKLEGELASLGGEGVVGEHPSLPEMKRVLAEKDAFMYCGHGNSLRTMPADQVERLRVRAIPLLFGCKSGQMTKMGRSLDPTGPAGSYIIASAPCILGFLWGITDKDIDQWTVAFMQHWLGRHHQPEQQSSTSANQPGENKENPSTKPREFVRAVAEKRSSFTRTINSAATVVYGLPCVTPD